MPHGKNKKKQFSKRSVYQTGKAREVNPFELKVNRQKHEVLGRKMSKTDKGIPGLSRSKAIKKVSITCNLYIVFSGVVINCSTSRSLVCVALLCVVMYK